MSNTSYKEIKCCVKSATETLLESPKCLLQIQEKEISLLIRSWEVSLRKENKPNLDRLSNMSFEESKKL